MRYGRFEGHQKKYIYIRTQPKLSHRCAALTGICMCGCHRWVQFMLYSQKLAFCSRPVGITSSNGVEMKGFLKAARRDGQPAELISTQRAKEDAAAHNTSIQTCEHRAFVFSQCWVSLLPVAQLSVWRRGVQDFWLPRWTLKLTHPHIMKSPEPRRQSRVLLCQPWSCNGLSEESPVATGAGRGAGSPAGHTHTWCRALWDSGTPDQRGLGSCSWGDSARVRWS